MTICACPLTPGKKEKLKRELIAMVTDGDLDGVKSSLACLRDRVGVPRNPPLATARHLRACLNWAIDVLSKQDYDCCVTTVKHLVFNEFHGVLFQIWRASKQLQHRRRIMISLTAKVCA